MGRRLIFEKGRPLPAKKRILGGWALVKARARGSSGGKEGERHCGGRRTAGRNGGGGDEEPRGKKSSWL